MSEWIEWKGGKPPAKRDTKVEVRLRDGRKLQGPVRDFSWRHYTFVFSGDIIAYRIIKEGEE